MLVHNGEQPDESAAWPASAPEPILLPAPEETDWEGDPYSWLDEEPEDDRPGADDNPDLDTGSAMPEPASLTKAPRSEDDEISFIATESGDIAVADPACGREPPDRGEPKRAVPVTFPPPEWADYLRLNNLRPRTRKRSPTGPSTWRVIGAVRPYFSIVRASQALTAFNSARKARRARPEPVAQRTRPRPRVPASIRKIPRERVHSAVAGLLALAVLIGGVWWLLADVRAHTDPSKPGENVRVSVPSGTPGPTGQQQPTSPPAPSPTTTRNCYPFTC
ncbi:hypothetical protein [Nocardia sp. NPDC057668]|uniref:hypothetical protein n=1 Tax=Nocardia sp. NPDC057668 TaxID=3346202 RepID=UPI00366BE31B